MIAMIVVLAVVARAVWSGCRFQWPRLKALWDV